jgi:homocysteine S-methyltransferase
MRRAIKALEPPSLKSVRSFVPKESKETLIPELPREKKSIFAQKLAKKEFVVSLEVVPPRGPDSSKALEIAEMLHSRGIDCVNIPDGPRASARMSAMALAIMIRLKTHIEPILHYTCRDRNLLGMQSDLIGLYAHDVHNILIVTGDPPKLGDYPDATAVFDVDSIGLTNVVHYLNRGVDIGGKTLTQQTGFHIGVCANPGAVNLDYEVSRFEWKVDAGAEFAVTQPVFDIRLLENFLERVEGVRIPILAGIWPLSSLRNAQFMHNEVPGAQVPPEIMTRMKKAQDKGPDNAREEGVDIAREVFFQIRDMVEGVQISPPLGKFDLAMKVLDLS